MKDETKIKKRIKQKTTGYIAAAFGLVAGLAWNDAITSLIEHFFPLENNNVVAKLIYALILTIILAVISVYLIRLTKKQELEETK